MDPVYVIVIIALIAAGVAVFLLKKKPKETAAHQGSFNAIFPSQYGGNTYAQEQQAGVVLFCTQGPLQGREFPLPVEGVVGGDPQAQLQLPNETTSAKLSLEQGAYILRGVNGQSFTYNDKQTTEAKLSTGDTLIFGKITMKVQVNS